MYHCCGEDVWYCINRGGCKTALALRGAAGAVISLLQVSRAPLICVRHPIILPVIYLLCLMSDGNVGESEGERGRDWQADL